MRRYKLLQGTRGSPGYTKYSVRDLVLQTFEANTDIHFGQGFGVTLRQAGRHMPLRELLRCDMNMRDVQVGYAADDASHIVICEGFRSGNEMLPVMRFLVRQGMEAYSCDVPSASTKPTLPSSVAVYICPSWRKDCACPCPGSVKFCMK